MNFFNNLKVKEFSIFFWIILISILGIITASIYNNAKEVEIKQVKSTLDNIYFIKTIKEITKNLHPRYTTKNYISKSGDTYESIINNLENKENENKLLKDAILNENTLKVLRINQKFTFKFDHITRID